MLFYWLSKGRASFVGHFCYLYFMFIFIMQSCLLLASLLSPAGKGLISLISCVLCFSCCCHFPIWCSGSGMVLDCIDSWSLSSSLHWKATTSSIWLFCLACLPGVSWLLCDSSSRCCGFVCNLWLWYFLIILTYYFCTSSGWVNSASTVLH